METSSSSRPPWPPTGSRLGVDLFFQRLRLDRFLRSLWRLCRGSSGGSDHDHRASFPRARKVEEARRHKGLLTDSSRLTSGKTLNIDAGRVVCPTTMAISRKKLPFFRWKLGFLCSHKTRQHRSSINYGTYYGVYAPPCPER